MILTNARNRKEGFVCKETPPVFPKEECLLAGLMLLGGHLCETFVAADA